MFPRILRHFEDVSHDMALLLFVLIGKENTGEGSDLESLIQANIITAFIHYLSVLASISTKGSGMNFQKKLKADDSAIDSFVSWHYHPSYSADG